MKFHAFISYRRADGARAASRLRRWLLDYRLPPELAKNDTTSLKVYQDTIYERASDDFYAREIKPALDSSKLLIVVATPSALLPRADGSPNWMVREIEDFLALRPARPIVVGVADSNLTIDLPAGLAAKFPNIERVDISGLKGLRRYRLTTLMELDDQLLKFAATLYAVPPESMPLLRREESKRRSRRLWTVAASAAGASVVMAGLLVAAVVSQVRARQAEWEANANYVQSQQSLAEALASSAASARALGDELGAIRLLASARAAGITPRVTAQTLLTATPIATFDRTLRGTRAWHIAFDADGLLTSAFDGSVHLHALNSSASRLVVRPSSMPVADIATTGRGRYLIIRRAPADAVWNAGPGGPNASELLVVEAQPSGDLNVRSIQAPSNRAHFLSVASPADTGFAIVGTDAGVFILNLRDLRLRGPLPEPPEGLRQGASVAVTSDGAFAAASTREGRVRMWDLRAERFIGATGTRPAGQFVYTRVRMRFRPNGRTLAFGAFDGSVRLWEAGSSAESVRRIPLHDLPVASVAWSPDGRLIAAGSYDGTVSLTSWPNGDVLSRLVNTTPGTTRVAHDLAFSLDGRWLAMNSVAPVSSGDSPGEWLFGAVRLWAIRGADADLVLDEGAHGLAFDRSGRLTAWSDRRVVAVDGPLKTRTRPCVSGHIFARLPLNQDVSSVARSTRNSFDIFNARGIIVRQAAPAGSPVVGPSAMSHDGLSLAYLTARTTEAGMSVGDVRLNICSVTTDAHIASVQLADTATDLGPIVFLKDSNAVLVGVNRGSMSRLFLWDAPSSRKREIAVPQRYQILDAVPLTATTLALADDAGNGGVLDVTTDSVAFAAAGLCCDPAYVSGLLGEDSFVSATGAQLRRHTFRDGVQTVVDGSVPVGFRPTSIDVTRANRLVIIGDEDGSISIWDGTNLILIARKRVCQSPVFAVRASPDGRTLATLCSDGVRLWGRYVPDDADVATRLTRLSLVEGSTHPLTQSEEDSLVARTAGGFDAAADTAAAEFWRIVAADQPSPRPGSWFAWLWGGRSATSGDLNKWLNKHRDHPLAKAMHLLR